MTGTDETDPGQISDRTICRVCGSRELHKFLSLGPTPLANSFLEPDQLGNTEGSYPLDVCFCSNCHLVQLAHVVSPEVMFREYAYETSAANPMQAHFAELAEEVIQNFKPDEDSLVVDIGSNDGTLLQNFLKQGFSVLGIEPASNIAQLAESRGIQTVNEFFDDNSANNIREGHGQAGIITATNVFAHVDNLEGFLHGIDTLLADSGVFIIEVPHLLRLIEKAEFDTIYHEHLSYFSIHPLIHMFQKFGMVVVDVQEVPVHGGSIRVFVQKSPADQSDSVSRMQSEEQEAGLYSLATYTGFAEKVKLVREELVQLLKTLKEDGATITGYGAPAKGNTLLNYCSIGTDMLDYITDTTPSKQGRYTPGTHIPVLPEEKFHEGPPDYALLLAWNYADEILKKEQGYRKSGGKFILPIPRPEVI